MTTTENGAEQTKIEGKQKELTEAQKVSARFREGMPQRITHARNSKKLSRRGLYLLTGITDKVIESYEAGRTDPGVKEILAIAFATDRSLLWLQTGQGPEAHFDPENLGMVMGESDLGSTDEISGITAVRAKILFETYKLLVEQNNELHEEARLSNAQLWQGAFAANHLPCLYDPAVNEGRLHKS